MQREVRITKDGSPTLFVAELDEHYHSIHGALQESLHVFIEAGLQYFDQSSISILEIGFGTGLNAWLTALKAQERNLKIQYVGIEKYPVSPIEFENLKFDAIAKNNSDYNLFQQIHAAPWEEFQEISSGFKLKKEEISIQAIDDSDAFELIYFDAFAPSAQPELWSESIFNQMFKALKKGGILVTYCAKGQVKRNMKAAGFAVERLPGPPGKREMTRAVKPH